MSHFPLTVTSSIALSHPSSVVFSFMSSGLSQTHWALGSMSRRALPSGLFVGTSRWSFKELYVKLVPHKDLMMVDYHGGVEDDESKLKLMVMARVVEREGGGCLLFMTTWRREGTDDESWILKQHVWPTEIALIKARSEFSDWFARKGEKANEADMMALWQIVDYEQSEIAAGRPIKD